MSKMFQTLMTGLKEVDDFLQGSSSGYKVTLPEEIDVKAIRQKLNMTQARFSDTFGFSLDAVKHWEGGRRTPESSARAFLTVIARNPQAVIAALHSGNATPRKSSSSITRGTRKPVERAGSAKRRAVTGAA